MHLLPIYLQDHLALSLGGIRLARRCRDENAGTPLGEALRRLVPELEEDRETLRRVARAIGAGRVTYGARPARNRSSACAFGTSDPRSTSSPVVW
jgi:hypothetical protein